MMEMAGLDHRDPEMPGISLLPVLQGKEEAADRMIFSEWHGTGVPCAWYMLTNKKFKYIYYERNRPSLFDMEADPQELNDLALDPHYAETLKMFESELNKMLDPIETARLARKDQGNRATGSGDYGIPDVRCIRRPIPGWRTGGISG